MKQTVGHGEVTNRLKGQTVELELGSEASWEGGMGGVMVGGLAAADPACNCTIPHELLAGSVIVGTSS